MTSSRPRAPDAQPRSGRTKLVVDGLNVIGSRPDGWWRDRRGAMARLAERLRGLEVDVCVVFDGSPWDGAPADGQGLSVRWAPVADEEIVRLVRPGDEVVTSDGALAARVRAAGATVVSAGRFRRDLDADPR